MRAGLGDAAPAPGRGGHRRTEAGGCPPRPRRVLAWAALAATVAVAVAGCGSGAPAAAPSSAASRAGASTSAAPPAVVSGASGGGNLTAVTVGAITSTQVPLLPYYMAEDQGYFRQAGLAVHFIYGKPPALLAAMRSGQVQFLTIMDTTANGAEKGLPFRIVAVVSDGLGDTIVGAKGIRAVSQLRGHDVVAGSAAESSPGRMAVAYLASHGLAQPAVHVLYAPNPGAVALLTQGKVAAIMTDTVTAIKLGDKGYPTLADFTKVYPLPASGVGTTLSEIRRDPAAVRGMVQAILKASDTIRSNEATTVKEIERRYHLSSSDAAQLWHQMHGTFDATGRAPAADVRMMLAADQKDLGLQTAPVASHIFDYSLLPPAAGGGS